MRLPEKISKKKQEEIDKKAELLKEEDWDKNDKFAIFIAALSVILPPTLLMLGIIYLIIRFLIGG